ncbi:MAG TPA: lysylphosphatidylglycerol synthase transmembrane domain-containing protein [Gemmatimonadaceae bacterium]|nr:lysylphosphatidylglycerol synthase transmembrane domain-containing protein [Gemmatimonadaceae bacterium]
MRLGWRGAIGLLVSAATIWWLVAKSGIDWHAAWQFMRGANLGLLVVAGGVGTLMFPLRAIRWGVILEPVAPDLSFAKRWRATAIGMMGNNILPFRSGEIVRPWVLHFEAPDVPFESALASLFVDRAFDSLVVLLLLLVATFAPGFPSGAMLGSYTVGRYAVLLATFVGALAVGLYALVFFPEKMIAVWRFVAHRLAPQFHEPGERMLRRFADGLSVLGHPARFARVFGWTVLHWLVQAFAFWIGFKALGVSASYFAALFVQTAIAFAVAVPSAPGFIGVFEKMAASALAVYGIDPSAGAAWAIAYHAVSLVPITAIGLFYVWRLGLTLGQLGSAAADAA